MHRTHLRYCVFFSLLALAIACGDDFVTVPPTPKPPVWSDLQGLPPAQTLYSIWAPRDDYAIAVGAGGTILRWDGLAWAEIADESTRNLFDIAGATGGETVAVGDYGEIVRYDGSGFVRVASPTGEHLRGLWTLGGNAFTAVGNAGVIVRGDGVAWSSDTSPVATPLFDVWGTAPDDIFAVGLNGVIIHCDGNAWTPMDSGTPALLAAVAGSAHDDVYAAGEAGTVLHFDGIAWSAMTTGTKETLQGIAIAGTAPVVVGSNGAVLTRSGAAWSAQPPLTREWLYAAAHAGTRTWAVGARAIYADAGGGWRSETRGAVPLLKGVAGPPYAPLRVVGESGYVARSDGDAWMWEDTGDTRPIHAIWCAPDGDVFAAGRNRIMRYHGAQWVAEYSDIWDLVDVNGGPSGTYATGRSGAIVRRDNAGAWTMVRPTTPLFEDLFAYVSVASDQAYIVGGNGIILRYNGATWSAMTAHAPASLYDAIAGTDRELVPVIAVGFGGAIVGISTSGMVPMDSPTIATLLALARGPGADLYAVGQNGVVIKFDGNAWSVVTSPTLKTLRGAWGDGENLFVAGGEVASGPVVLRYGPP